MSNLPAWLQAFAAIVQAGVAVMLWLVTAKYVELTKELATTASEQLSLTREAEIHRWRSDLLDLETVSRRLLTSLDELAGAAGGWAAPIRQGALWTPDELRELTQLAAKAGKEYAALALQPATDLKWMLERIAPVRAEDPAKGYELSRFPREDFDRRLDRSRAALNEIVEKAREKAAKLN